MATAVLGALLCVLSCWLSGVVIPCPKEELLGPALSCQDATGHSRLTAVVRPLLHLLGARVALEPGASLHTA
jgi:hypothetical protein